jgi:hypothetical protein
VSLVSKRTDNFRRERIIKQPEHDGRFGFIAGRHGAVLDLAACPVTNGFDIEHKLLLLHGILLVASVSSVSSSLFLDE